MNERVPIQSRNLPHGDTYLDAYMPENQLVAYEPRKSFLDFPTIRGILFRQRWLIGGAIATALVIGLIMTLLATPIYSAEATVRVQPYANFVTDGQDVDQGIGSNQIFDFLSTQAAVIQSRSLAEVVAKEHNLGVRTDLLGANIDETRPPNVTDEQWIRTKEGIAARILSGSVSAELPTDNWILKIRFKSPNRALAAEMANAYTDAFVAADSRGLTEDNEYAQTYLREEIDNVRVKLQEAEQAANNYARGSSIIVQPGGGEEEGGGGATLTSVNLSSINQRASQARADRIQAEQRWRAIQNLPAGQLPEVQNNPVLQGLVNQRTSRQAELVELRQRYNDDFPQIQNLLKQISALNTQIEAISSDVKATVRNAYTVARNQEEALQQELSSATGETLEEQDRRVQYSVLEREAQALRDQLQNLLKRYNEVSSAANVKTGIITKLDSATVPGAPISPNLTRNMTLALVFGIAFAGALAVLRETLDSRVRSIEDIEERVGIPLLGYTPFVDHRYISANGTDQFSALVEAYASIRSTIDFSLPKSQNVLQLTSSQASEGKTTTAVILAELFARLGRKVLLIDGDLRRPSVAKLLDIDQPKQGLVEVLQGTATLESAILSGVHENLDILPVAEIPINPTEIIASPQLRDFIESQRHNYSLIIFDSCPVMGLADAPILSRVVDKTIFVLEANRTNYGKVKQAVQRLRSAGGNTLGVILTKYRALEAGEDTDYQYNYYSYKND